MDHAGFVAWREAYEAAGISAGEVPPPGVAALLADATVFAASDARRAIESARLLAGNRDIVVSPLFRELELRGIDFGPLRLPLFGWALTVGVRALFRLRDSSEEQRVRDASAQLAALAESEELIAVVTHASFRRRLARQLLGDGWRREGGNSSMRHWSVWTFVRP